MVLGFEGMFTKGFLMKCMRTTGGSNFVRVSTRKRLMMKHRRTTGGSHIWKNIHEKVDDEP